MFRDGGCNRFAGAYVLEGELLAFEPLASTRMACEGRHAGGVLLLRGS
jgi:heat shock protein HslJ